MADEFDLPSDDYFKGFNQGYIVGKYMPETAKQIDMGASKTQFTSGFADGKAQAALDQTKDRRPNWLRPDRATTITKTPNENQSKTIDKDGREPER